VPGTQLDVKLATQVGQAYDAATIERDVRTLWRLGNFRDVQVETVEDRDGADVVFRVTPEPRYPLHELRLRPHTFGLQVTLPPGTLITQPRANDLALIAQRQLLDRGYAHARVRASLQPSPGGKADVMLDIEPGEALRLKLVGDSSLRAPRWYAPGSVDAHAARLRSLWVSRGYFDARVVTNEELEAKRAVVEFRVDHGRFYREIETPALCRCLFAERRESERAGVVEFQASVDESGAYSIEKGRSFTVGRINFMGHPHYSDALIRNHFLLDEGVPLDSWKLRQSIVRLNRAGLFEPLDEHQVHVRTDERTGVADITVELTERKRGSWSFSGPVPLSASIGSRLPAWGAGILELSTYTLSFNLLAYSSILKLASNRTYLPVLALDRPFIPGTGWLSGFSIAPQLSPKWMVLTYAFNQVEQRVGPLLAGTRVPDLTVTMSRSEGETAILCEAPKPRLRPARMAAGMALGFMKTLLN